MDHKVIKCEKCDNDFVWSKEEQDLYKERGIKVPTHCPICRGMMEAEQKYLGKDDK